MSHVVAVDASSQRPYRRYLLAAPAILLSFIIASASGYEALHVGLLASASELATYHFGSESMLGTGGWRYASRAVYVLSCTVEALAATLLFVLLAWAAANSRSRWVVAGTVGVMVLVVVMVTPSGVWGW